MNHTDYSFEDYRAAAGVQFGDAGLLAYDMMADLCECAFKSAISPARRLHLVDEKGIAPYNRATGWACTRLGSTIVLLKRFHDAATYGDFLLHELCHIYQQEVLGSTTGARGPHRTPTWYEAISVATENLWSIDIRGLLPRSTRTPGGIRKVGAISEVEATHFPDDWPELPMSRL